MVTTDYTDGAERLLDTARDITDPPPADLIAAWLESDRAVATADTLLAPYSVSGIALCSDSSGLTRMSQQLDIIELVAHLSEAKEILHAVCKAAGGCAPGGRWVADNCEVFFPAEVPAERALRAAQETHALLADGGVKFGISLHKSSFFLISGGLVGPAASLVEHLAEEFAGGGETLVTESVHREVESLASVQWQLCSNINQIEQKVFRGNALPRLESAVDLSPAARLYPLPFAEDFYAGLRRVMAGKNRAATVKGMRDRYLVERTVFIAECAVTAASSAVGILDSMVFSHEVERIARELAPEDAEVVESLVGLVLVTFRTNAAALDFAYEFNRQANALGLHPRMGLDRGPVLLSQGRDGRYGIMGSPVNFASKEAHELGEIDRIYVSDAVAGTIPSSRPVTRFQAEVSGIRMRGIVLDPARDHRH